MRNQLQPARQGFRNGKLPDELLVEVFRLTVGLETAAHTKRDTKVFHKLSMVCHQWARVILSTPAFWVNVDSNDGKVLCVAKTARSGTRPLQVKQSYGSGILDWSQDSVSRWETLAIFCQSDRWMELYERVACADFASLVHASIKVLGSEMCAPVRLNGTDQLRTLDLDGVWPTGAALSLAKLSMHNLPSLALSSFLKTLRNCSNLHTLILTDVATVPERHLIPCELTNLKSLTVKTTDKWTHSPQNSAIGITNYIYTPTLQEFTIDTPEHKLGRSAHAEWLPPLGILREFDISSLRVHLYEDCVAIDGTNEDELEDATFRSFALRLEDIDLSFSPHVPTSIHVFPGADIESIQYTIQALRGVTTITLGPTCTVNLSHDVMRLLEDGIVAPSLRAIHLNRNSCRPASQLMKILRRLFNIRYPVGLLMTDYLKVYHDMSNKHVYDKELGRFVDVNDGCAKCSSCGQRS